MNPEFLRQASAEDDFECPRVIVIGADDDETDATVRRLYEPWSTIEIVSMPTRTAQSTKYVANLFNAAKIGFFKEMHAILADLGVDSHVAFTTAAKGAEGLWNPLYGTRGGAPYGGGGLPNDVAGFLGVAEELGAKMFPLRAVVEVNADLEGRTQ
jgi:UDPglucose 6-dehydrogenase